MNYEATFYGLPFAIRTSMDAVSRLLTIEADLIGAACGVAVAIEPVFSGDKRRFVDGLVSAEVERYLPSLQAEYAR